MPALSCLPINSSWFWKDTFLTTQVKDPKYIINENIIPFNNVYCNFILNVAPNRKGLIDDNAVTALKEVGKLWKNTGDLLRLPENEAPVISSNLAKHVPCNSSWSKDMDIMDFANDDDYTTAWVSNPFVQKPWIEMELGTEQPFNMITITERGHKSRIKTYRIEYMENNVWKTLLTASDNKIAKIQRFEPVWGNKVKIIFEQCERSTEIAEIGIYNEKR